MCVLNNGLSALVLIVPLVWRNHVLIKDFPLIASFILNYAAL